MKALLIIVAIVAAGAVIALEKLAGANLRAEIDVLQQHNREIDSLQRERERLQRLQPQAEELARLESAGTERDRLRRELLARKEPLPPTHPAALSVGEWLPPTTWKNRGQTTPAATVETVLWAAAGGDVARLRNMLELDPDVRVKAEEILTRLPEPSRALYPTPEHLIAAFTTKAIPLGDAQLVWQHQPTTDEAVACVFVKNTESVTPMHSPAAQGPMEKIPPMGPSNQKTVSAYLSLRRLDDDWKVVVPMSAVEKIAKALGASTVGDLHSNRKL
jgi:hypothetical protein